MLEQLNKVFKNIFSNEETIIFSLAIVLFFIVLSLFGSILTPFMISIVVAYLLVGLQKKIQSYDIGENVALILTFSIFIITGAALLIWLVPLLYTQLQAFILDVPNLINNFLDFIADLPGINFKNPSIMFFLSNKKKYTSIGNNIMYKRNVIVLWMPDIDDLTIF